MHDNTATSQKRLSRRDLKVRDTLSPLNGSYRRFRGNLKMNNPKSYFDIVSRYFLVNIVDNNLDVSTRCLYYVCGVAEKSIPRGRNQ